MNYRFKTIDIEEYFETCIKFRKDWYCLSFGIYAGVESEMTTYQKGMNQRLKSLPQGNCHLWSGNKIIGQIEMKCVDDPYIGYVNLLDLIPELRAKGLREILHLHAV